MVRQCFSIFYAPSSLHSRSHFATIFLNALRHKQVALLGVSPPDIATLLDTKTEKTLTPFSSSNLDAGDFSRPISCQFTEDAATANNRLPGYY
ncbi:hypothetical protein VFPPC_18163 [Pochonia chlamydosporia 170]|uniref:Uncharacterized protein n=1 Tax=Pochonia chlamydosporia 170 TaxID=1380566 RepID=A0A219ATN4_METCM|nr:hypothetical protein VFPPC_18163 [Pochonia chlamydosporia 170]OWT43634.1 hypothetical protein VFPPC_18163 [Pochonia chlamydosporia 170]